MLQLVRAFQFNDTQLQFCIVCEDYFLFIVTLLATVDDWRRVADQVHCETMVVAVSPMDTLPPASKAVSKLSASW